MTTTRKIGLHPIPRDPRSGAADRRQRSSSPWETKARAHPIPDDPRRESYREPMPSLEDSPFTPGGFTPDYAPEYEVGPGPAPADLKERWPTQRGVNYGAGITKKFHPEEYKKQRELIRKALQDHYDDALGPGDGDDYYMPDVSRGLARRTGNYPLRGEAFRDQFAVDSSGKPVESEFERRYGSGSDEFRDRAMGPERQLLEEETQRRVGEAERQLRRSQAEVDHEEGVNILHYLGIPNPERNIQFPIYQNYIANEKARRAEGGSMIRQPFKEYEVESKPRYAPK